MLRHTNPPQNMLNVNMNAPPFIAPPAHPGQPAQPQQPHLSLLGGNSNPAPPMGLLGGAQQNANGPNPYQALQMQGQLGRVQAPQHRPQGMLQPGHPTPGMNPGMGPSPPLVNGLNQHQLQAMQFNPMMQGPVRRAPSQPQMSQPGMNGMPNGQPSMGLNGMPGMPGMSAAEIHNFQQQRMRQQMIQQQHQAQHQHQQRQLQQQQQQGQHPQPGQPPMGGAGNLPPELLARGQGAQGAGFIRSASQPQMPGVPQPPTLPSHPGGMQASFNNPLSLQQQHQPQPPIGTSPHPTHANAAPNHPNVGLPGNGAMPPNAAGNRPRMTPDPPMFLGFQGGQQMGGIMPPGVPRIGGGANGGQFTFGAPSHQSNNLGDLQPLNAMGTPRAGTQTISTPAQALDISQNPDTFSVSLNMGPPSVPTRPPSQQRLPPGFQMPQPPPGQQPPQHPQQHPPHARQHTPLPTHRSPRPQDLVHQLQNQRPPSQPQVPQGQSPRQQQPPQQPQQPQQAPQPTPQQQQQHQQQMQQMQQLQQQHQQQQLQQQQHQQQLQQQHQQQQAQPGPSRTPRMVQPQLPANLGMQGRPPQLANQGQPPKPPTPAAGGPQGGQHVPIMARSAQGVPVVATGPQPPPAAPQGAQPRPGPLQKQPAPILLSESAKAILPVLGNEKYIGAAIYFMERFNCILSKRGNETLQLQWWENHITNYFSQDAVFKLTLWKDGQKNEAKPFEIGVAIVPRFFLVTAQSGVHSMRLSMPGVTESRHEKDPFLVCVESMEASWTFTYTNGYTVNLRGPMTAYVRIIPGAADPTRAEGPPGVVNNNQPGFAMRIESFHFDAENHEKLLSLETILASRSPESPSVANAEQDEEKRYEGIPLDHVMLPAEPVNAFGIPQATMRCLELAESVMQMGDLIRYSKEEQLGPRDALAGFARILREDPGRFGGIPNPNVGNMAHKPPHQHPGVEDGFQPGMVASSSTLFNGPSSDPSGSSQQAQQGASPNVLGTPRPGKAVPNGPQTQPAGSTPGPSAATPAAQTPTAMTPAMTPAVAPATLKRKNPGGDSASPTTANGEPAPKRAQRKRTRTQNGP